MLCTMKLEQFVFQIYKFKLPCSPATTQNFAKKKRFLIYNIQNRCTLTQFEIYLFFDKSTSKISACCRQIRRIFTSLSFLFSSSVQPVTRGMGTSRLPVQQAGRSPGLQIFTHCPLPGHPVSSGMHSLNTVTSSYRILTCFPFHQIRQLFLSVYLTPDCYDIHFSF